MQPAYGTGYPSGESRGYRQAGSPDRQQGYVNGTYPPMEMHYSRPANPPQMHNSGQVSRAAEGPGAPTRNAATYQPQSRQFGATGNAVPEANPSPSSSHRAAARQQLRNTEDSSADNTSCQSRSAGDNNVVKRKQATPQSNPHIVKSAVLHPPTAGKFLYLLSLIVHFGNRSSLL